MITKTYGLFDTVAKNFVRTFVGRNDEDAERAAKYVVREQNFDPIAGVDMVIFHLYDMDSETGKIVDNDIHEICSLRTAYEDFKLTEGAKKDE